MHSQIFEMHPNLRAAVVDFVDVKLADLSGLMALLDVMEHAKKQDLRMFIVNVIPEVQTLLSKIGVVGDDINQCSDELRDEILTARALAGNAAMEVFNVESLGLVTNLLKKTKTSTLWSLAEWTATSSAQHKESLEKLKNNPKQNLTPQQLQQQMRERERETSSSKFTFELLTRIAEEREKEEKEEQVEEKKLEYDIKETDEVDNC